MKQAEGLLLKGAKSVELRNEPVPEPGEDELLIRVDNFGLCGSDIHLYHGTYSGPKNYPLYFGHEWGGIVEEKGNNVTEFAIGDQVVGDCSIYCGECEYCKRDKNQCKHIEKYGITVDGASRQYLIQNKKYLYKIPPGLSLRVASLLEPIAVTVHGAQRLRECSGEFQDKRILVFGGGTIGLSALTMLQKYYRAQNVQLFDVIPFRMQMAKELGAREVEEVSRVDGSSKAGSSSYSDFFNDLNYDVIFETTGVASVFNTALQIVKPLGSIVSIGFIPEITMNLKLVTLKALKIIGSIGGTGEFEKLIPVLQENQDYFSKLVTHSFNYKEYDSAFEAAIDKKQAVKVQIHF